jgi:2-oxoglutarate dehydrogenase E2 component (dihydrolipoamide succinyltransferase)
MSVEIVVPTLGESVTEATVAQWLKKQGEQVGRDEPVVELETDKVTLEVNAPAAGVISEVKVPEGENVEVGAVLGTIEEGAQAEAKPAEETAKPEKAEPEKTEAEPAKEEAPAKEEPPATAAEAETAEAEGTVMPAARKMIDDHGLDAGEIKGTGKGGRITKEDVLAYLEEGKAEAAPAAKEAAPAKEEKKPEPAPAPGGGAIEVPEFERPSAEPSPKRDREERVRMTKLRQTIAGRLKQAQNTAAILTTFNEIDMTAVMDVRARYRDTFEKKHGVRLGFMSFFVKAAVQALKEIPAVNAEIDGNEIVYKNYYDIGIAVGSPSGLVVPVLRDADAISFAEVEKTIGQLGRKARDGKLTMPELTGGTFTITNGGIYGSLLSTPIINPPQSAILGMHKVQQRPMMVDGSVQPRPMMYVAVSYDHRIIDGSEAVTFLVRIKECVEDPERLLLGV